jgi:hypothetical protein
MPDKTSQLERLRTIRIGNPIANTWQTEEVPDDPATFETVVVLARAIYLERSQQETIEAWDFTGPERPKLLCCWVTANPNDVHAYERMCRVPGFGVRGNGFRPANLVGPITDATPRTAADHMTWERMLLAGQRKSVPRRGLYRRETLAVIDELARRSMDLAVPA